MSDPTETVLFTEEKAGRRTIGVIVLNNPRALNALTLNIFDALEDRLFAWRDRDDLACVILHAESAKAFCAGGDVKALVMALLDPAGVATADEFFTAEYRRRLPDPCLS